MHVWNVLHAAHWKYRTQIIGKNSPSAHHRTTLSACIFATKACIDNRKKNLLNSNISSTCPHNMVNFGPLAAEIVSLVWGTPANFSGFRIMAPSLHSTLVVGVSQTLWHWTEGATYNRQGGHHVGHWPTFLVYMLSLVIMATASAWVNLAHLVNADQAATNPVTQPTDLDNLSPLLGCYSAAIYCHCHNLLLLVLLLLLLLLFSQILLLILLS